MTVEAFITGVSALVGGNGGGGVWEDGVRTGFFLLHFLLCFGWASGRYVSALAFGYELLARHFVSFRVVFQSVLTRNTPLHLRIY